jgi:hypothetical protein
MAADRSAAIPYARFHFVAFLSVAPTTARPRVAHPRTYVWQHFVTFGYILAIHRQVAIMVFLNPACPPLSMPFARG